MISQLEVATSTPRPLSGRGYHALQCSYPVSALSGGDDVTARQPGCGRDFAS